MVYTPTHGFGYEMYFVLFFGITAELFYIYLLILRRDRNMRMTYSRIFYFLWLKIVYNGINNNFYLNIYLLRITMKVSMGC